MIFLSLISTIAYYGIYSWKLSENKINTLNNKLASISLKTKYNLDFYKSLGDNIIESREVNLFILDKMSGNNTSLNIDEKLLSKYESGKNRNKAINSIRIFNSDGHSIFEKVQNSNRFYTNETRSFISVNSFSKDNEHLFYLVKDSSNKINNMVIVRQYYSKYIGEPVFIEIDVSAVELKKMMDSLLQENKGFLKYSLDYSNEPVSFMDIDIEKFELVDGGHYKAKIVSNLVNVSLYFDSKYISLKMLETTITLIIFNIFMIFIGYFAITMLIGRMVIDPIQKLSVVIGSYDPNSGKALERTGTGDEIGLLNDSYVTLFDKIHHLSNSDPLTGLSNRISFNKSLNSLIKTKKKDSYIAVFYIDLNNFKSVNDDFGHEKGDTILKSYADKLVRFINIQINKNDFAGKITDAARLGGDEFVVAIGGLKEIEHIKHLANKISMITEHGLEIGTDNFDIFSSVGVSYSLDRDLTVAELVKRADSAMYFAKSSGRNEFALFDDKIESNINEEKSIEARIRETLVNDDFFLTFMPCVDSSSERLVGFEALLRAPTLLKEGIGPDRFIPIAEKTDLIIKIDRWVASNAINTLKRLVSKYSFDGIMAINMSSKSLRNDEFYLHMKKLISSNNINPNQIEIELTETCILPNDNKAISSLNKLKSLGLKIALDDFGTGYTSFSQIVNYPLDTLKIDRSFVNQLDEKTEGKPAIDIIYELAKVYGLSVIVEGIETNSHYEHIKELGCDMAQGYFFSKPKTINEIELDYFVDNVRIA